MSDTVRTEFFDEVPTRVVSGPGALSSSRACLAGIGVQRALVVCGENVSRLGQVEEYAAGCEGCIDVAVFRGVSPDPKDSEVLAGGAAGREAGAEAVIGIGGGSSMDAAKAIAVEIGLEGWITGQDRPGEPTVIEHEVLPIVCVPTTAGTGSEVNPFAVITFAATQRKVVLRHETLQPRCAVLDPTLLGSAPSRVRVAAGLDALTHAIESYVNVNATADTRKRAAQAIRAIAANLRAAAADADDLQAQEAMQRAAMIASLAFAKTRLGIVHAMALPLSALFGVPHGVANAILLPHGMRFNAPAASDELAEIAELMGEDVSGLAPEPAALRAAAAVEALARDVGAPARMSEVGVQESAIERMADDAMPSAHIKVNPREITRDDIVRVYHEAM